MYTSGSLFVGKSVFGVSAPSYSVKLLFWFPEAAALLGQMMAAMAGVDIVDTALSPLANGTAQPATESLVATLQGTPRDTGLDLNKMSDAAVHFRKVAERLKSTGSLDPKVLNVDPNALLYQVPGGMLSNLVAQLTAQGKMDKFDEVLLETPRVRADLGYPPLVTPMSQMVGVQATNNVLSGERYKNVSKEVKSYLMGEYGKAPGDINEDVRKQILGDVAPIEGRFADTLEPAFEAAKAEIGEKAHSDEDVLSYIAFPAQAEKYFDYRDEMEGKIYTYEFKAID